VNVMTGDEVERSSAKHSAGEVAHEGTCSEMKVAKYYIRAPTANKSNDTNVDTAMALPARQERAETSSALKPSWAAKIAAEVRMVSVTSLDELVHGAVDVALRTAHNGASGGAPWRRR
jgi:hypothetical protein